MVTGGGVLIWRCFLVGAQTGAAVVSLATHSRAKSRGHALFRMREA